MNHDAFLAELEKWRFTRFSFETGRHCTPFVNAVLRAGTGRRPFPHAVSRLKSLEEAQALRDRVLRGRTTEQWMDRRFARVNPLEARTGAILAFPEEERTLLGYSFGLAVDGGYAACYVPLIPGEPAFLGIDKALSAAVHAWDFLKPLEPARGNRARSR